MVSTVALNGFDKVDGVSCSFVCRVRTEQLTFVAQCKNIVLKGVKSL